MSLVNKIRALLTMGQGMTRGISELTITDDPIAFFGQWFRDAQRSGLFLPESMTLATASSDGTPSARMMLLKGASADGFVFFTNYESRKSMQLADNPRAALVFHWPTLQRQVRVEGTVERLSHEESNSYFQSRPRGSRLGAWASKQSEVLADREELERRFLECEQRFKGKDVPLPPFWGGYRLRPQRIEFWQGRLNRLHDRICYNREGSDWKVTRLYP